MAIPTILKHETQNRHFFSGSYGAISAATDNFADTSVLDVSALTGGYNTAIKITKLIMAGSPGVELKLEFDDDSADEFIALYPIGVSTQIELDFTKHAAGGLTYKGTGGTGDIVVTSSSIAVADSIQLYIEGYVV